MFIEILNENKKNYIFKTTRKNISVDPQSKKDIKYIINQKKSFWVKNKKLYT